MNLMFYQVPGILSPKQWRTKSTQSSALIVLTGYRGNRVVKQIITHTQIEKQNTVARFCLLYTSDAADDPRVV